MLRPMAKGGVEREFKLQLGDAHAFEALRGALKPHEARTARQENHFFDTPARGLRAAHLALRLRSEEERWFLTLKGPRQDVPGALSARAEEELELDAREAQALLEQEADPLGPLERGPQGAVELVRAARRAADGQRLARLGSFLNERTRLGPLVLEKVSAPLVLELDHTRFPGAHEAFELEVEVPESVEPAAVERALRALLAQLGLPWRVGENKAARFFRLLDARAGS